MLLRNQPGTVGGELQGMKLAISCNIVISILVFFVLLVTLILASIAFDILKDVKISKGCDDWNSCTVDFERNEGGCVYYPKPKGSSCNSQCYGPAEDLSCHYLELTKGILTPKCHSPTLETCLGTCNIDEDCPNIEATFGVLMGECKENTCYYIHNIAAFPVQFPSNEIPELECNTHSEIFQRYCDLLLLPDQPLVHDNCLVSDVQCEEADLFGGGFTQIPACHFYFWCSAQDYQPVILAKRRDAPSPQHGKNKRLPSASTTHTDKQPGTRRVISPREEPPLKQNTVPAANDSIKGTQTSNKQEKRQKRGRLGIRPIV